MNNPTNQSTGQLPSYITSATPNPAANRAPWFKNTAPTYAGIFLWFVFWQDGAAAPTPGGMLSQGVAWALISLALAALVCYFLFYLVPGLLGQKTGLPLYIVGTSTFGASGGFIMPGFLMGVLQFGWLGVNVYFSSLALAEILPLKAEIIMVIWGVLAAFVGLKGIQYVAKVATYLPLIPLVILAMLVAKTAGSVGNFSPAVLTGGDAVASLGAKGTTGLSSFGVLAFMMTFVVGFFATAGAAGVDFGTNSRDSKDVKMGGIFGIAVAILLTAGLGILIVAGVYGNPELTAKAIVNKAGLNAFQMIKVVFDANTAKWMMFLLAIAAFPPACFSSFIAANSFKTTLPGVNPFVSVGIGAAVSIILAITGYAGKAIIVFQIIGASFGPICGAMMVDYLINGKRWTGPRAGFNPAGWIAWAAGFGVGILPIIGVAQVPAAPVAAFIVGTIVYFVCAKAGLQSQVIDLPAAKNQAP
jgi:cytosine permease